MKKVIIFTIIIVFTGILAAYGQQFISAEGFYQRGMIRASKGLRKQANDDFTAAIKLDPKHIPSYLARAQLFTLRDRVDLAIADFTTAIKIDPNLPDGYVGRGTLYRQRGDARLAIEDFNQVIRIAPDSALGYTDRARTYDDLIKDSEAEADFAMAIKVEPDETQAYFYRGFMYYKRHKYALAIADMSNFLGLEHIDLKQRAEANVVRSMSYLEKGDHQKALECANLAIKDFPSSSKTYYARALVYRKLNKEKLAAADERKAKRLSRLKAFN